MTFTYKDKIFCIEFGYSTIDRKRAVTCRICDPADRDDETRAIARGWSACVPSDNFVKETGRKLSLERALEHPYLVLVPCIDGTGQYQWDDQFPKDWDRRQFRTAAWAAYFGRLRKETLKDKKAER